MEDIGRHMVSLDRIREEVRKLSPRQRLAARLLASGDRPRRIAKRLHVDEKTVWTWRKLPKFQRLCEKYWQDLDAYIQSQHTQAVARAFEVAVQLMNDPNWRANAAGAGMILNIWRQSRVQS